MEHEITINSDSKVFVRCHEAWEGRGFGHSLEEALSEYVAKQKFNLKNK